MAVHVFPFSVNGEYMKSVKDYVPYFDHINIMAYDINGAWATTTGPNAPLFFEKGKGEPVSFVSSIKGWIDAGVPAEKINAGLAYYGRAIETSENMKSSQYAASKKGAPKGDSDDAYWQDPFCQVDEGGFSGIWKWKNLRSQGIIGKDGKAGNGYTKHWDSVSQTPWLYNEKAKTFISYEDPESIKRKVDSALCLGIGGVMAWDIHQDNGELLDVVHGIHGTKPDNCAELESMAAKRPAANNAKAANNGTDVPVPDASTQDVPVSDDTTQDAPDANVTSQDVPDPNWQPSTTGSSDSPMLTEGGETTPTPEVMPTPEATQIEEDMPQPAADLNQKCQAAEVKCMSGEGSPEYHECVYERFMVRLCAAGTVCRTENGVAACGAPVSDSASTMEMPISQNGGSEMVVGFPEAVSAKDVKEEVMRPSTVSAEPFPAPALVKGTEELEGLYDLVKGTDEVEKPTFDIPEDFVGDNFGDIGSETTGGFTWPAAPTPTA
ncbi:hypothetical protein NQZ79_g5546 [Umbelopsis isabellina]|nr:hypothetical protein NQZ79_g5546 [Umbelopsis isabellina]